MQKTVYLVRGSTGEYDDHYSWVAKAFEDQGKAEDFCIQLNNIAQRAHAGNFGKDWASRNNDAMYQVQEEVSEELRHLDPKASVSTPGTSYRVEPLEVEME